jgi:polysaccharide biosynthesis protein VpsJ
VRVAADSLVEAARRLGESAAAIDFRGPDPYDGLFWRWPRPLVGGRRRRQAIIQLHARLPVDVRRLYRRQHALIPKALGVYGSVGVRASHLAGTPQPPPFALHALELLAADRAAGAVAWGYHWDVQTRWSFYAAGSPNVVATSFAAAGLLEGAAATGRAEPAARARAAARWVLEELWVEPEGYFAYHPGRPVNVHNASLLGAWLVHVALDGDAAAADRVARAVERTLAAQRADGSWAYGEGPGLEWADSFHTGYVLSCLERMRAVDPRVDEAVARGAAHYRRYFDEQGRARLWAHKPFPEDGHSAGTGLTTLALLQRRGLVEPDILERVAARLLRSGLRDGHVVHRRYRRGRSTVRYLRWCDAHVALGLVDAAAAMAGEPDLAARPRRCTPPSGRTKG